MLRQTPFYLSLRITLPFILGLLSVCLVLSLADRFAPRVAFAAGEVCFATADGGTTVYSSTDASAVRNALDVASANSVVKVAGTCAGVATQGGSTQVALITQTLTLRGGYTETDWINSYPLTQPTTLDAQGSGRVISVSVAATFEGLTLTNGYISGAPGAGLYSVSTITLTSMTFYSNVVTGASGTRQGGGAYLNGVAQISGTAFLTNTSYAEGGGAYLGASGSALTNTTFMGNTSTNSEGGGLRILASGAVSANNLYFYGNRALGGGGGGGSWDLPSGQLLNSQVISNSASNTGGGFYFHQATTISNTTFSSNRASNNGGGAYFNSSATLTSTTFTSNTSTSSRGGGLYVNSGTAVLSNTLFTNNQASVHGGGLFFANNVVGTLDTVSVMTNTANSLGGGAVFATSSNNVIRNSTFANNTAGTNGGGAYMDGAIVVTNTQFVGNAASALGGALYFNAASTHAITNTLFARNRATTNGAAIYVVNATRLTVAHATIVSPTLPTGATQAIYVAAGTVHLTNTIVASHTLGLRQAGGTLSENYNLFSNVTTPYQGTVTSGGNSITGTAAFYDTTNYTLTASSAAVDVGDFLGLTTDYYGETRHQGYAPDIGADESPFSTTTSLSCYATLDNGVTVYGANTARALRGAITAASAGGTVKIAGTCAGVVTQSGSTQVVYLNKLLTLRGGYTLTDWINSYPVTRPTTLDAQLGGRVVYANVAATLEGFTVTRGSISGDGGGIYAANALTLTNMTMYSNTSSGNGGGIYASGEVTLTSGAFTNNTSSSSGGGGYFNSTAMLTATTFTSNTSSSNGGGGYFNSTALLTATTFTRNTASSGGGGTYFNNNANITYTTFLSNTAGAYGGGMRVGSNRHLFLAYSTLSGNTASGNYGGGIFVNGSNFVTITHSTLSQNTANSGGGAYADNTGASTVISYTTIVSNTSTSSGGGGGLDLYASTTRLGGVILAYNRSSGNVNNMVKAGGATLTSLGYNLEDQNNAGLSGTGDQVNTDPLLGTLADNGGGTQTHALLSGSPAIDVIPNGTNGCGTAFTSDQRGYTRPVDSACDIGAYELQTNYNPVATDDSYITYQTLTVTAPGVLENDSDGDQDILTATLDTAPMTGTLTFNSNGSFIYTPTLSFLGVVTFTYLAHDGELTDVATVNLTVQNIACFTEITGDNVTDYSSADASAVRAALGAASAGSVVKVAGTCSGVTTQGGAKQVALITQTLTLRGGYTNTEWTNSYPVTQPTTLNAFGGGRVISASTAATLEGFTLTNGYVSGSPGGGLYSANAITLTRMTFYSNTATGTSGTRQGGGAYLGGVAQISGTAFLTNTAYAEGGGAYLSAGGSYLTNTIFMGNQSTNSEGGGLRVFASSAVVADGLTFYGNRALGSGGGASSWDGPSGQLLNSQVISNSASGTGGGFYFHQAATVSNTTFLSNKSGGNGGGAYFNGTATVTYTTLLSNTSGSYGGGAYFNNDATITHTTFLSNTAGNYGGGLRLSSGRHLFLAYSTLSGNIAQGSYGGGIFVSTNSFVTITHSTLSQNTSANGGGAFSDDNGASTVISYTTIVSNTSNNFGGGGLDLYGSTTRLGGVILAYNRSGGNASNVDMGNGATLTSLGYNLEDQNTAGLSGTGDLVNTDPLLGVLSDNGGGSQTHALLSGSPAIDMIPNGENGCGTDFTTDQRGYTRPVDSACDIGAYELETNFVPSVTDDTYVVYETLSIAAPGVLNNDSDGDQDALTVTLDTAPATGALTFNSDGSFIYTATLNFSGVVTFTYLANDGQAVVTATVSLTVPEPNCFATSDNGITVYSRTTASALRNALAFASPSGVVKVAGYCPNVETQDGSTQVALITQTLTLRGGYTTTDWSTYDPTANPTTLDAQSGGRVISASVAATLEGFTLTNGYITDELGAGLYAADALTLTSVAVYNNVVEGVSVCSQGGGAYVVGVAQISATVFLSNTAAGSGGGTYFENEATLTNTAFISNTVIGFFCSSHGGGAYFGSIASITGGTFSNNQANFSAGGAYFGGAASVADTTFTGNASSDNGGGAWFIDTASVTGTTFTRNAANSGGGARFNTSAYITNTAFTSNTTNGNGGGAYFTGATEKQVVNALFASNTAANQGAAIYVDDADPLRIIHATIVSPTLPTGATQAVYVANGTVYLTNTIVASHTIGLEQVGGMVEENYNLFDVVTTPFSGSISTGVDSVTGTAGFYDTTNYTLTASSQAIEIGAEAGVTTDYFGAVRPQGVAPDIGYAESPYLRTFACYATPDDGTTLYWSNTAQAVRNALAVASANDVVKIAGYCAGATTQAGSTQVALITQTLTLRGGYTNTDWVNTYPLTRPTTLNAQLGGRVLSVTAEATLEGFTLTNGYITNEPGAGLYAINSITLTSLTFYSNTVAGASGTRQGGGAYLAGAAEISGTAFLTNTAYAEGGGLYLSAGGSYLTNTTFMGNTSTNGEAGGLRVLAGSAVIADGLYFYNNRALGGGGGAGSWDGPDGQLLNSQVISNTASAIGGGFSFNQAVQVSNSTFSHNFASSSGGAYFNGATTVTGTTFSDNQTFHALADLGGGAYFNGSATLTNTTFSRNRTTSNLAHGGGAFFANVAQLTGVTFTDNSAVRTGGGASFQNTATLLNTAFIGNTAGTYGGGAIFTGGNAQQLLNVLFARNRAGEQGAAIYVDNASPFSLIHTTIVSPTFPTGAPQAVYVSAGTVYLTNTLIASHTVGIERETGVVFENYNLFDNVTTPYSGSLTSGGNSITGTAAFKDPANDNYRLMPASSAVDAIPVLTSGCGTTYTTDHDGTARPQNLSCDIGAYELVNSAPAAVEDGYTTPAGNVLTIAASGVLANDSDVDGDSLSAILLTSPDNGALTFNSDGSFTYTPTVSFAGVDDFTYQATDGNRSDSATVSITVGSTAVPDIRFYGPGWNMFGWPLQASQAVTLGLDSIDGYYKTVYYYDAQTKVWELYDITLPPILNDLDTLNFGQAYWITVTQDVTLTLSTLSSGEPSQPMESLPPPPATYYGRLLTGQPVLAGNAALSVYVGDTLCGLGRMQEFDGAWWYIVNVAQAIEKAGCGQTGAELKFKVNGQTVTTLTWQGQQVSELDVWLAPPQRLFLPMIAR